MGKCAGDCQSRLKSQPITWWPKRSPTPRKHAQASELTVTLNVDDENLHVLNRDDGVGGADSSRGSGLIGLKDRVEALGAQLDISSPAGNGTALRATVPLYRP
jgi:signal transduction histidine kinase